VEVTCSDTSGALDGALAMLREREAAVSAIEIREPSLEDAFLHATGREFEPAPVASDEADT